jgi:hypothetical protein
VNPQNSFQVAWDKQELHKRISTFLATGSSSAKGNLTRFVNSLEGISVKEFRSVVSGVLSGVGTEETSRLTLLKHRFIPGSPYEEGNRVFGWWHDEQLQAEELPLYYRGGTMGYSVSFHGRDGALWRRRGFELPSHYPLEFGEGEIWVRFDFKSALFFASLGFANPCSLQWYWNETDGLVVSRSIISEGFWQAWKWWEGASWWYLEKRPELFADIDWWGEELPQRFEPPEDNPYAAVLGIEGREYWEKVKI